MDLAEQVEVSYEPWEAEVEEQATLLHQTCNIAYNMMHQSLSLAFQMEEQMYSPLPTHKDV